MADQPSFWQRIRAAFATIRLAGGTKVTPVDPGKQNDGINRAIYSHETDIDRPFAERTEDMQDALEASRKNPLAKRIIDLVTAYVIGDGINLTSKYEPLQRFIDAFWQHERNRIKLRQADWCNELTRSGEIFLVLFTNPVNGMSQIRAIPASRIDAIEWQPGDYELELAYHEVGEFGTIAAEQGTWWKSFDHPDANDPETPIMLHFAINRPVGAVRGEGDLISILPWLRRYDRWLADRVRMNAGMRSFLWIVYAPKRAIEALQKQYQAPPEPGSVIIAEEGAERWEPIAPNMHANDAQHDGRAIRWHIAAGGPGTSLPDFGEPYDANQATATVMVDIRKRFLRRRQAYFAWMLAQLTILAYRRSRMVNSNNRKDVTHNDIIIDAPEISGEDSLTLASAARDVSIAMINMQTLVGDSETLREESVRLFFKMVEEDVAKGQQERIVKDGKLDRDRRQMLDEELKRAQIKRAETPNTPARQSTPDPSPERISHVQTEHTHEPPDERSRH